MKHAREDYNRIQETAAPSDGVALKMTIDLIDGEELDTCVDLSGSFCVAGSRRKEFTEKVGALIEEYRI